MQKTKANLRKRQRRRSPARLRGSETRPRLVVFRSQRFLYLQVVDDEKNRVLGGFDTRQIKQGATQAKARELGKEAGFKLSKMGIKSARFDRARYKYHGQVKALAEGLRESGIQF